jgi:mono/diheme cytochrome c family protein
MQRLWLGALALVFVGGAELRAETPLERGAYLVNAVMGCGNCHTPRDKGVQVMERQLSGGFQTFSEPWFVVKGANITPDKETGIGAWTNDDIKRALTHGTRPNGTPLAEVMPSEFYKILTPRDLDAVVAYLKSVAPIRNEVQAPNYKSEPPSSHYPPAETKLTDKDLADPKKRGLYLATLAHCMACHARTSADLPADYKNAFGKGGRAFKGPWGETVAANITSHPTAGLGSWTDAELKRALVEGVSRDGRKLKPPMIDHVGHYKKWTEQDISALVAWVRTIPPLP